MEYKIILSQNSFFVVYLCRLASFSLTLSPSLCYTIIFSSFCCCCKDSFILCGCYSYSQVVVFSFSVYPISHYCYFCLSFASSSSSVSCFDNLSIFTYHLSWQQKRKFIAFVKALFYSCFSCCCYCCCGVLITHTFRRVSVEKIYSCF